MLSIFAWYNIYYFMLYSAGNTGYLVFLGYTSVIAVIWGRFSVFKSIFCRFKSLHGSVLFRGSHDHVKWQCHLPDIEGGCRRTCEDAKHSGSDHPHSTPAH